MPAGFARVRPGESIETFAQRVLGDPTRWAEIWALNRNQPVGPDGETWTQAWRLGAGWQLRLPDTAAGPIATPGDGGRTVEPARRPVAGEPRQRRRR